MAVDDSTGLFILLPRSLRRCRVPLGSSSSFPSTGLIDPERSMCETILELRHGSPEVCFVRDFSNFATRTVFSRVICFSSASSSGRRTMGKGGISGEEGICWDGGGLKSDVDFGWGVRGSASNGKS